jgi:hypothetical protein
MSLATVASNSLISQTWQNLYSIINSNVSDPKSRGVQWVFAAWPQSRKGTADVYPCITIDSPDMRGQNVTMGQSKRMYTWTIPISISDTRMDTVDGLAGTVIYTIESNKGSLEANGMNMFNPEATPTFHNLNNKQIIHQKNINVRFEGYV